MGDVVKVRFRQRHARTPSTSRAAKRVSKSAVTPADLAFSVSSTADHHSGGMRLRDDHFRTAQLPAPTSVAIASSESQSSMIEVNEVKSDMARTMGQLVPKIKAIVSHDYKRDSGQNVPMVQTEQNQTDLAWEQAFRGRLKQARGARSQADMAELLCITRDAYSKYEGTRGTIMPVRLMPKFCKICAVSLEWLIEGDKVVKTEKQAPAENRKRATR